VRLRPIPADKPCTRCGQSGQWLVRTIFYAKGEKYLIKDKDSPFWQDPFVGYEAEKKPIVPKTGRVVWREFAGLFLVEESAKNQLRPSILSHIAELALPDSHRYPFRCIGVVTRQAKFSEWIDADVSVALALLRDSGRGKRVKEGLAFAEKCANIIAGKFAHSFGKKTKDRERHLSVKKQMLDAYWNALAQPFLQEFTHDAALAEWKAACRQWVNTVREMAFEQFKAAADRVERDANYFQMRAIVEANCRDDLDRAVNRQLKELKGE
jgi:hypothetical protein